jgi:hypothetical protein
MKFEIKKEIKNSIEVDFVKAIEQLGKTGLSTLFTTFF